VEFLEEGENGPLDVLHSQNNDLLQQISHIAGGGDPPRPAGPTPAGPAGPGEDALQGLMAGAAGGAGGEGRMAGIKEALTAVKPIMDKYVNTAKTLTGKYTALKSAYSKLKAEKGSDPAIEAELQAKMKQAEAEDAKKYDELEGKLKDTKAEEAEEHKEAEKEELSLKTANAKLDANNQAVAKSFMVELESARKAAKDEINNMKSQLNQFMSATNQEKFNALGEATSKAIEEKKTLQYKKQDVQAKVQQMLQQEEKAEMKSDGDN
jgi:hypothetical protein